MANKIMAWVNKRYEVIIAISFLIIYFDTLYILEVANFNGTLTSIILISILAIEYSILWGDKTLKIAVSFWRSIKGKSIRELYEELNTILDNMGLNDSLLDDYLQLIFECGMLLTPFYLLFRIEDYGMFIPEKYHLFVGFGLGIWMYSNSSTLFPMFSRQKSRRLWNGR